MEVGRWDKKNNHHLHAILQPHYPGVHFLKNIEWSLSMAGKPRVLAINALLHSLAALTATFSAVAFYCYLYDAKPPSKWILREFDVSRIRPPAWRVTSPIM